MASKLAKDGLHGVKAEASTATTVVTSTTITGAAGANPTQAEYAVVVARVNALTTAVNSLVAITKAQGLAV